MNEQSSAKFLVVGAAAAMALLFLFFLPIMLTTLLILGEQSGENGGGGVANVPAEYVADVIKAGGICKTITPPVIAAQIEAESNWNPKAGSGAGAQGIAQFMPATWATHGKDGDGDGKADIWNPHDAIWSQGNYMCELAGQVDSAKGSGRLQGDTLQLTLAAYNAGIGAVLSHGGIPPYTETQNYVKRILGLIPKYTAATGGGGGATAGKLSPGLKMKADGVHVDVAAMGIQYTWYGGGSGYQPGQCTWWAANRRANIGHPVTAHMGNGGAWANTARSMGWPVGHEPRLGAAMSISPGLLGSDPSYGHVAVVEQINPDGSIVISESGVTMPVKITTISAAALSAVAQGIWYVY
ncbi:lytic transglycosylase domain-containing protein [Bifidobacterium xylocopae]|uniref:Peptidase C51 domain-containing protein n=1 Tax=Bifidobacterium xylocopae TaxID=2493119 RepID=A0A366KBR9_9BIFI|nr:lytic transglycosylase domain-containing protein [Bifidobacterium xylocopae]RBP98817.1 hypothetical protein CRD59_07130 [Bifidobacterium xylocopae]